MPAPTHLATVWQNARALRERGDLARSKSMLEHAVEAGGAAYGIDHPDVLETTRILAGLHRETGELTAARRTLEEALAAGQLSLAENHPLMLLLAYDLGLIADELGNKHEARRNLAPVARLGPAALGHEHPAVRTAASYLGGEGSTPPPSAAPAPPPPTAAAPTPPPPAPLARFVPAYPIPESPVPTVGEPSRPRRRRTPLLVATVIAGVAVATAVTTAAVVAIVRPASTGEPGGVATTAQATSLRTSAGKPTAGPGPTEVRLRDDGASVTLTWRDPSPGTVPFIVAGGRAGEQARPFANLPAGKTSHTLHGLNPRLEYCFTVVAVYSTESFTASELVCTRRTSRSPQPTRS